MSTTDTDVIVTEYAAQFRAEPFARPRWTVTGRMECKRALPNRRRHTVARALAPSNRWLTEPARKVPDTGIGHVHASMLLDPDAVVVFVPAERGARFGSAFLVEQIPRDNRCPRCAMVAVNQPELHSHILRTH